MLIGFLRHGPTTWNAEHRLQGRTDIPLSAAGRAQAVQYRLPDMFRSAPALVSPLQRAWETASLAGCAALEDEPLLIEMHWGDWEGRRLAELRDQLGSEMKKNEDKGLDFQPPGGESPRDVQTRLQAFFEKLLARQPVPECCLAVTHKGVIRAALALAWGWDMMGKPPVRLDWAAMHMVRLDPDGTIRPDAMNVSLLS
ncbi:histidine phosphatase family protein [Nisaea nitritireducens]|uniref:histidine phosphatase family protein n=1 Tax=Nisaea nitritireducens TaxID=568392 RepID=UPI00186819A3|nr:histidine phosphatase family protein [Nisaea nitritireducens]